MRSAYTAALKKQFHALMGERFPEFAKTTSDFGGVVYRHEVGGSFNVFVFLLPSPQLQRFTIELAVGHGASFPFHVLHGEVGPKEELRLHIRALTQLTGDGYWYVEDSLVPDTPKSEEEAPQAQIEEGLALIPGLVESAVTYLKTAIPGIIRIQSPRGKAS